MPSEWLGRWHWASRPEGWRTSPVGFRYAPSRPPAARSKASWGASAMREALPGRRRWPQRVLMLVTDRRQCGARALPEIVGEAVDGGVNVVQLREKDLPAG